MCTGNLSEVYPAIHSRFIRVTRSGVNLEPRTVVDLARGGAVMSRPMEECEVAILNGGDNPLLPSSKEAPRSLHTHIHGAPSSPRILRLPVGRSHPSAHSLGTAHTYSRTRTPALIGFTQAGADVTIIIKA